MKTLFISDLHLEEQYSNVANAFFDFLKNHTKDADALYILGDFFEVWIGDDDLSPFHLRVINALSDATKHLPIFIMHGNRDFLLGKKFMKMTGCKLLPDEYVVNLYGERILLMHGDTLCTQDVEYLKFRKKVRNWFVQKLFLLKSLKKRRSIADNMRNASKEHTKKIAYDIMDVTQSEVERVMQKHQVNYLIHGHTHREGIHNFLLNNETATRVVLGAWHERGSVLVYEKKGAKKLLPLLF